MPRLPIATDRDSVSGDALRVYDEVTADRGDTLRGGALPGPVAVTLPYVPEIAGRISHLGTAIRYEVGIAKAVIELATIATARGRNNPYVWAAHAPNALAAGVTAEVIEAVNSRSYAGMSDEEALIVRFAREIVEDTRLSQATYDAALKRFGETGVMELSTLIGYYAMLTCILTTVEMEPREGAPPLK